MESYKGIINILKNFRKLIIDDLSDAISKKFNLYSGTDKLTTCNRGTFGTATTKTAGSASGNVPLNGAALGTTNYNAMCTNASGNLIPYGKTIPQLATFGVYITEETEALTAASYAYTASLTGFALSAGAVIRITFAKALQSNQAITSVTLNVNGTGAKRIVARRAGIKSTDTGYVTTNLYALRSHEFAGGNYNSTYKHKVFDAFTTLELMYTGTYWLIMGESILCDYASDTIGYTIKSNGLINQYGESTATSVNLFILYQTASSYKVLSSPVNNRNTARYDSEYFRRSTNGAIIKSGTFQTSWETKGY